MALIFAGNWVLFWQFLNHIPVNAWINMRFGRFWPPHCPLIPDNVHFSLTCRLMGCHDDFIINPAVTPNHVGFVFVLFFPHQEEALPADEQLYFFSHFHFTPAAVLLFSASHWSCCDDHHVNTNLCYDLHYLLILSICLFVFSFTDLYKSFSLNQQLQKNIVCLQQNLNISTESIY